MLIELLKSKLFYYYLLIKKFLFYDDNYLNKFFVPREKGLKSFLHSFQERSNTSNVCTALNSLRFFILFFISALLRLTLCLDQNIETKKHSMTDKKMLKIYLSSFSLGPII